MEAAHSSEDSLTIYHSIWRHISEEAVFWLCNPVHTHVPSFFRINMNILLPITHRSLKKEIGRSSCYDVRISCSSHGYYIPLPSSSPWIERCIMLNIFKDAQNGILFSLYISSSLCPNIPFRVQFYIPSITAFRLMRKNRFPTHRLHEVNS